MSTASEYPQRREMSDREAWRTLAPGSDALCQSCRWGATEALDLPAHEYAVGRTGGTAMTNPISLYFCAADAERYRAGAATHAYPDRSTT